MDLKPDELYQKVKDHQKNIDYGKIFAELSRLNTGAWNDVLDLKNCGNYQWLSAAMDLLKPQQCLELGGAMGVGTLCMISVLPTSSKLYSITLAEHGLEFSFIGEEQRKKFPNMNLLIGNDLSFDWGEFNCNLIDTDFWYIDSEHSYSQLHTELECYKPFFKKGAIICFDDIALNEGMKKAWEEVTWPKYESDLHYTGWGISIYE